MPGLRDHRLAASGHHPDGLGGDRLVPSCAEHAAFGLADDLGGDHDDVSVGEGRCGGGDQLGQVGALPDLRQALHTCHGQFVHATSPADSSVARSTAAAAIAAAAGTSVMYSGSARTAIPASSASSTASASDASTSQPFSNPG